MLRKITSYDSQNHTQSVSRKDHIWNFFMTSHKFSFVLKNSHWFSFVLSNYT